MSSPSILRQIRTWLRGANRELLDRREDAGYPRGGSVFDGFGLFGGLRSRKVRRSPGRVIGINDARICIEGPSPYDEMRERCFRLEPATQAPPSIALDDWVTIIHRGPYALRIERD